MSKNAIRYTSFALDILSKIIGSNFQIHGIEKIPKKPVLFVANHFTRSETFFLPYLIYQRTKRQVRCLADSTLFQGDSFLGNFLETVGAISTADKKRDKIILNDLVNGHYDWMIYPEGKMIKNKRIERQKGYTNLTSQDVDRVRTGSAVLALKSEIYRQNLIKGYEQSNEDLLKDFKKNFGLTFDEKLLEVNTSVVPVSVTYYPLRPGKNKIQNLLTKIVKKVPKKISEELEIEGNLLLSAEIDISFGDPIYLKDYIKDAKMLIDTIPIIGNEFKSDLVIKYFRQRLTDKFMTDIYHNLEINFDHIFATTLSYLGEEKISIMELKQVIYLSATTIEHLKKYRLNDSLSHSNLVKMFSDEKFKIFDDVLKLACDQKVIKITNDKITLNHDIYFSQHDFHEIRRENSLKVVANEFLLLERPNLVIKKILKESSGLRAIKVFNDIFSNDLDIYKRDYQSYFDANLSKDREIGTPFTVNCNSNKSDIGIVLIHGYKSAPKEVEELSNFLQKFGFKIYAVRLKGHGTAPINLKYTKWQDWYSSVSKGYSALNNICKRIIFIGFSTGGLLSLLSCINKLPSNKVSAIISINSALRLRDIRSHLVPGINIWNDLLEKLHIEKGRLEYIDNIPENPHINYSRNYLHGVAELEKLMDKVEDNMNKISSDTLIIQSKKDPVVKPESAKIIYKKISTKNKDLCYVDANKHVIINDEFAPTTFSMIEDFLKKRKLIKS